MKTLLIASLTAASLFAAAFSNAANEAANEKRGFVTIRIDGIEQSRGQAIFVVMDSESSHHGESPVYSKSIKPIVNQKASVEMELPVGEYSAVVYHDVNSNGKLDANFFGKPKEPYGFSNDARNRFGIPSFIESRFIVESSDIQITITVK